MIKIIAFDLIGVLAKEKNITLNDDLDKIERLFGKNKSDDEFISQVKSIFIDKTKEDIISCATNIINTLYEPKVDLSSLIALKEELGDVKFVVATNHVSYIKDYIIKIFGKDLFSDIFISACMNEVKPDVTFYTKILDKLNIQPSELLFLDDNISNINAAKSININTIHISKENDIIEKIKDYLK